MAATDVHIVVHRSSSSHNGSFPAKSYQGVSRPPSLHSSASISIIGSLDIRDSGSNLSPFLHRYNYARPSPSTWQPTVIAEPSQGLGSLHATRNNTIRLKRSLVSVHLVIHRQSCGTLNSLKGAVISSCSQWDLSRRYL
jgi:hypothetical protein